MAQSNDGMEFEPDETAGTDDSRPQPSRSRSRNQTKSRRKPRAKRASSTDDAAKRGIHQRRNKRVNW